MDLLRSHEDYTPGIEQPFEKLCATFEKEQKSRRRKAVVLDAFAGVGTGIVVLKRLGIAIDKIIHVEHDKVATHVYKFNHDREYNPDLPDDGGIEHIYYPKWESLMGNVEAFYKDHGRKSRSDS